MAELDLTAIASISTPGAGVGAIFFDSADKRAKQKDDAGVITSLASIATQSMWVPASDFIFGGEQGGTAPNQYPLTVSLGTLPNTVLATQLADAVCSGVHFKFLMPADARTAAVTVRPVWAPGSTDASAHSVAWRMAVKILTGADVTAAGNALGWTGDSLARTINVQVVETGLATTPVTPAANDWVRIALSRDGNVAADSYVGAVNLLGVRLDFGSGI